MLDKMAVAARQQLNTVKSVLKSTGDQEYIDSKSILHLEKYDDNKLALFWRYSMNIEKVHLRDMIKDFEAEQKDAQKVDQKNSESPLLDD